MKRGQIERVAQIETEARKMARSGAYHNASSIESVLVEMGYPEARKLFANRWTHSELNRLCDQAIRIPGREHIGSAEVLSASLPIAPH
jgi:hypothetical protein